MRAFPDPDQARRFVEQASFPWVQRFELAPGVVTPGAIDVAQQLAAAGLPDDLSGLTVVDVGTLNGAIAFEAERRGAARAIAVGPEPPGHYGVERTAELLGSSVEYERTSLYELPDALDESADVVVLMSGLHHFRHPLLALDALRRVTRELLLLQSAVSDGLEFHRRDELGGDPSNWFTPSPAALVAWCGSAGFDAEVVDAAPCERPTSCIVRAVPVTGAPEFEQISPEERMQSTPARGRAGLPPRVSVDLDAPASAYWEARVLQSADDSYMGVPLQKMPESLRVYEHLMWMARPDVVIELGVYRGASTLWFRDRLRALASYGRIGPDPRVIGVDVATDHARAQIAERDPAWSRTIDLVTCDVLDPTLPERVAGLVPHGSRCMVVEDAAHVYETTLAALDGFARFVPPGGFFVVEDGYVDVPELRVVEDWPRGVLPAVDDWLAGDEGRNFRRRRDLDLYGLSNVPDGILQRRRSA